MEGLEVGPAVQICRGNRHEIDVLGHEFCERVAIVFGPCVAKFLRQFAHRFFICFGLIKDVDVDARRPVLCPKIFVPQQEFSIDRPVT